MEEQQKRHPKNTTSEEQITEEALSNVSGGKDSIRRGLISELESEDTTKGVSPFNEQSIEQTESPIAEK
ncbi:MAG: hypothetical protein AAGJ95_12170 [Cyanobacteria bacterium J06554_11]